MFAILSSFFIFLKQKLIHLILKSVGLFSAIMLHVIYASDSTNTELNYSLHVMCVGILKLTDKWSWLSSSVPEIYL